MVRAELSAPEIKAMTAAAVSTSTSLEQPSQRAIASAASSLSRGHLNDVATLVTERHGTRGPFKAPCFGMVINNVCHQHTAHMLSSMTP